MDESRWRSWSGATSPVGTATCRQFTLQDRQLAVCRDVGSGWPSARRTMNASVFHLPDPIPFASLAVLRRPLLTDDTSGATSARERSLTQAKLTPKRPDSRSGHRSLREEAPQELHRLYRLPPSFRANELPFGQVRRSPIRHDAIANVNGNRKPHICGNRKLHTSGRYISGGADVLPLMLIGRFGLDAGSGATGVLANTRREAAQPAVTLRLSHAAVPTQPAASADAPASGSCCPGC